MNFTVNSGGMQELKLGDALPCISGRGVGDIRILNLKTQFVLGTIPSRHALHFNLESATDSCIL